MTYRVERDSMGEVEVPETALYGAQTRRAELNFPVSGWRMPKAFLLALARIKRAAAVVNRDLGLLDPAVAGWIVQAADEVLASRHDGQFPLDVFQTGSATSTNMNMNEVLSNRAIQLAGGKIGSRDPVHPNDHVNLGQSSNDLTPTAAHIAASLEVAGDLLPALEKLRLALHQKSLATDNVVKIGRTHLQDAVPIRLGQAFRGYAGLVEEFIRQAEPARDRLLPLALGGTAAGTGLNAHPEFAGRVIDLVARETGTPFRESGNHFAAQSAMVAFAALASALKTGALGLVKIANDVRFLASGPRAGLGEIVLPPLQPGSSIMPGKVNPVMCETLMQASALAVAADAGVSFAAATLSNFELAAAWPYAVWQTLDTVKTLAAAIRLFTERAVAGIEPDAGRCRELSDASLSLATGLAPRIGYDLAAAVAKRAAETGGTVMEAALELSGLPAPELEVLLDPAAMTGAATEGNRAANIAEEFVP
ncbi:MAG: class II fumarate hydratase [Planctomycetota bacterium]|jgi:fumarate hydratase class II|nr:class II fumarate hydratase [Planctomycetota bacterium]